MKHKGIEVDPKPDKAESNDLNQFDTDYKDTVISIMQQAKDNFLEQIRNGTYKKGMGVSLLLNSMGQNATFIEGTKKLFDVSVGTDKAFE